MDTKSLSIQYWSIIPLPYVAKDAQSNCSRLASMQVALHVLTLAFVVVGCTCGLLIPIMLYVFQMQAAGWQWYDAALFGSMIASTDAVAIVAVLKQGATLMSRV